MDHPRVLHLCVRPMGTKTGTGLTFGRLYEGWPDDRLMQFCLQFNGTQGRGRMALIPATVSPADGARRLKSRVTTVLQHRSESAIGFPASTPRPHGELRALAGKVLETLPIWLSPTAREHILDFDPEVIHFGPWGVRSMRLATHLSRELDIPVVPHYMDTDLDTGYLHRRLGKPGRNLENRVHSQLLDRVPICLVIGTDMGIEYSRRLDRTCVAAGNSIPDRDFATWESQRPRKHSGRVFYYAGSLYNGRGDVIAALAQALQGADEGWRIEISTPPWTMVQALDIQARHSNVKVLGSLEPVEVAPKLAASDFLLMVESTDEAESAYTRLSVSTKVPEYLAAGRPVLAIGPAGQSSLKELSRHGRAVHATPAALMQDLPGVLDRLLQLEDRVSSSPDPERAAHLVRAFGSTAVRDRFRECLRLASDAGPSGRVSAEDLDVTPLGFAAVNGKLTE